MYVDVRKNVPDSIRPTSEYDVHDAIKIQCVLDHCGPFRDHFGYTVD